MGCYVNPKDMSKEEWLSRNAIPIEDATIDVKPGEVILLLVNNGAFTALGVMYSEGELMSVLEDGIEKRPHSWWLSDIEAVRKVSPYDTYVNLEPRDNHHAGADVRIR